MVLWDAGCEMATEFQFSASWPAYTPPMPQDTITRTLALLKPDDLLPA